MRRTAGCVLCLTFAVATVVAVQMSCDASIRSLSNGAEESVAEPVVESEASFVEPVICDVAIDGQMIESLILHNVDHQNSRLVSGNYESTDVAVDGLDIFTFEKPGQSISVPEGRYYVQNVTLRGGYVYYNYREDDVFEVTPDGPNRLVVGGPLSSSVRVDRAGRYLQLNYVCLDNEGREYTPTSDGDHRPTYSIMAGGRELHSGTFEYG